jgi:hypothetical protein
LGAGEVLEGRCWRGAEVEGVAGVGYSRWGVGYWNWRFRISGLGWELEVCVLPFRV